MIAALVLAAGQSRRMGRPKMPLPWGETTVLGTVIRAFRLAGVEEVLVVTGGDREAVEAIVRVEGAAVVFNADHEREEMLRSLQVGLEAMGPSVEAAFIALGDQPQIRAETIRSLAQAYAQHPSALIVPSYRMRRGHPWLLGRELWPQVLAMQAPQTPRDFLHAHAAEIQYVDVTTPSILDDIDTPEQYGRARMGE